MEKNAAFEAGVIAAMEKTSGIRERAALFALKHPVATTGLLTGAGGAAAGAAGGAVAAKKGERLKGAGKGALVGGALGGAGGAGLSGYGAHKFKKNLGVDIKDFAGMFAGAGQ